MSQKVIQTLNKDSGDVFKFFQSFDHLIDNNSGIRDNRTMTFDSFQSAAPFHALTDTNLQMSDPNMDIINIDK